MSSEEKKAYKAKTKKYKRLILALILVINFGILAVIKYYGFTVDNINALLSGCISYECRALKDLIFFCRSEYHFIHSSQWVTLLICTRENIRLTGICLSSHCLSHIFRRYFRDLSEDTTVLHISF